MDDATFQARRRALTEPQPGTRAHHNRSRHRQIRVPGPRRWCCRPSGDPPGID